MTTNVVLGWLAYAWTKQPGKDGFIFASNLPGLIFSLLLVQFCMCRKR